MNALARDLDRCPHCGALDLVTRGERIECLGCGKVMRAAELTACPRCGEILPSAAAAAAHSAPRPIQEDGAPGPRGVAGWLFFLALGLAVLGPGLFILALVQQWHLLAGAMAVPGLSTYLGASFAIDAAVTAALAFAGVRILAAHPRAIPLCRRALVAAPLADLAELGLAFLVLDGDVLGRVVPPLGAALLRRTLFALGWLTYLGRSRRVRATFPE